MTKVNDRWPAAIHLRCLALSPILGLANKRRNMRSAGLARLESLLQARKLDSTLTNAATRAEMSTRAHPTGMAALDEALGGGWRQGEISEIVGRRSTGRTSLLVATLAEATRRGAIVGLVDAFDRFDPFSASRSGLDLRRVLWIRGPSLTLEGLHAPSLPVRGAGRRPAGARGPGAGDAVTEAIRRAISALDLLLRAGGFAIAALDLGEVPARAIDTLPLTTWMRLAHANEGRETVCLLLGEMPMARSARGASVRLESTPAWCGTSAQARRFTGFTVRAEIAQARQMFHQSPQWQTS